MAVVPLYRLNDNKANSNAVFPEDYTVVAHAEVDDWIVSHPEFAGRHWSQIIRPFGLTTYAVTYPIVNGDHRVVPMHRIVWEIANGPIPKSKSIDHANRNGLDNRLCNLRLAGRSQQSYNMAKQTKKGYASSPFKGVSKRKDNPNRVRVYKARVALPGRIETPIGNYEHEVEAAFAYNVAIEVVAGQFAAPNDIPLDSISPDRQQEIRSVVERKLRDRGLIPSEC